MERRYNQTIAQTRPNYGLLIFSAILVLFLSWLIEKNVNLPTETISLFIALGLFVAFFVTFKKVEYVFYLLVAYLPFNRILVGDFGEFMRAVNLTNLLILLVLFGWITTSTFKGMRLYKKTSLDIPILIFSALGILSLIKGGFYFGSDYLMNFIIPLKRWLTPIFLFFLASNIIRTDKQFKNVIIIMMIVVVVAGLMAIYEYLDIGAAAATSIDNARVGGIAEQPNMLGAFFVYYMFILAGFWLVNWKSIKYWLLTIPLYICYMGIRVTFSRGAYLAFGFAALAIAFFRSKLLFFLTVITLIVVIINPILVPAGVRYRMGMIFNQDSVFSSDAEDVVDASARARLTVWKGSIQLIKDYPWGIGYGLFPHFISFYLPVQKNIDAHNTYLIIAAEMGIITLMVFLWVIAIIFKNSHWLYRRVKDPFFKAVTLGMLAGIAGFLMANMFGSRLISAEVSSYFWILAGLIMAAVRMKRSGMIT